jgi:hypothetical protein
MIEIFLVYIASHVKLKLKIPYRLENRFAFNGKYVEHHEQMFHKIHLLERFIMTDPSLKKII